jgi:chromate transporter
VLALLVFLLSLVSRWRPRTPAARACDTRHAGIPYWATSRRVVRSRACGSPRDQCVSGHRCKRTVSLLELFLTFLKIGSVLYGSGYELLAFLRRDFVERLGWLTDQQLPDTIAVGQVPLEPVFTTATFIGYLVASLPGALLATLAIFLPAFAFVAVVRPVAPRLGRSSRLASLLDGLNMAAVALMAGVLWELGRTAIGNPLSGFLALGALVALLCFEVNSA